MRSVRKRVDLTGDTLRLRHEIRRHDSFGELAATSAEARFDDVEVIGEDEEYRASQDRDREQDTEQSVGDQLGAQPGAKATAFGSFAGRHVMPSGLKPLTRRWGAVCTSLPKGTTPERLPVRPDPPATAGHPWPATIEKAQFVNRRHRDRISPDSPWRSDRWITSGFGIGSRVSMS